MNAGYMEYLIKFQRNEAQKNLSKESVAAQFAELLGKVDQKTLEYLSCQLSLLQSFMKDGEQS